MIQVNQLYITEDNYLVIDAQIVESAIFSNVVFDYIAIDTYENYVEGSISSNATIITDGVKGESKFYITQKIDVSNPLLFVHFVADASGGLNMPAGMTDLPCTWDEAEVLEVVCDMQKVYKRALNYVKEASDSCSVAKGFIDFILQYNMFKACLNSGAYDEAIKWWKKITENVTVSTTVKTCGCYGK